MGEITDRLAVLLRRVAEALANGNPPDPYDLRWLRTYRQLLDAGIEQESDDPVHLSLVVEGD